MLKKLSSKLQLSETEIKVLFFICSMFFIGLAYSLFYKNDYKDIYKFDYSKEDSIFFQIQRIQDSVFNDKNLKSNLDYRQKVLDFKNNDFKNYSEKEKLVEKSINLNTTTLEQLINLPGVGRITAQKILDYRNKKSKFRNIDELLNVKGIGQKKFLNIKKYIYID